MKENIISKVIRVILIVFIIIFLIFYFDTTIKSSKDIEEKLPNIKTVISKDVCETYEIHPKTKDKVAEITKRDTPAVILHSGGTTGTPKGIVLSNGNFNAATIQAQTVMNMVTREDSVLAIMPIFHGFGLSVSINDVLSFGAKVVLIPTFKASEFDKLLTKYNVAGEAVDEFGDFT